MVIFFDVTPLSEGGLRATCFSENIETQGCDLADLYSNLQAEIDRHFAGRAKPDPRDVRLCVGQGMPA